MRVFPFSQSCPDLTYRDYAEIQLGCAALRPAFGAHGLTGPQKARGKAAAKGYSDDQQATLLNGKAKSENPCGCDFGCSGLL